MDPAIAGMIRVAVPAKQPTEAELGAISHHICDYLWRRTGNLREKRAMYSVDGGNSDRLIACGAVDELISAIVATGCLLACDAETEGAALGDELSRNGRDQHDNKQV